MKTYKVYFRDTPFSINKHRIVSSNSSYSIDEQGNLRVGENIYKSDIWSDVEFMYDNSVGGPVGYALGAEAAPDYYYDSPNVQGVYSNG
jgi:hypothetical protein